MSKTRTPSPHLRGARSILRSPRQSRRQACTPATTSDAARPSQREPISTPKGSSLRSPMNCVMLSIRWLVFQHSALIERNAIGVLSFDAPEQARARCQLVVEPQPGREDESEDDDREQILLHAQPILAGIKFAQRVNDGGAGLPVLARPRPEFDDAGVVEAPRTAV